MPIEQAAYNTVHEAPGGAKQVAASVGLSYQVLLNKVNPRTSTHRLLLMEAVQLMHVAKDTRILEALASEFNGMFVPLPALALDASPNLMSDIARMSSEFGALVKEIADDLGDGRITENEWTRIDKEAANLRSALAVLMRDLRRLYQASQPATPDAITVRAR